MKPSSVAEGRKKEIALLRIASFEVEDRKQKGIFGRHRANGSGLGQRTGPGWSVWTFFKEEVEEDSNKV